MMATLEQHERVKMQLRLAGSSLAQVARELGVTRTTVTIVCKGMRRSYRIEQAISTKLGVTAAYLWPDRYPDSVPSNRVRTSPGGAQLPIT